MNKMSVSINFNKVIGNLNKNLHGSGFAPDISSRRLFDFYEIFLSMQFTATRNHDWAIENANQRLVDIHHIFPLMHLDADDERNYVWGPTDEIMRLCYEAGTKVLFRLGTSIEHTGTAFKFNKIQPDDPEKYADVCVHVMRHYLQGWSNGFHYDIAGWEIWNEPEHECMWDGTEDEFALFFAIVLNRLKHEFPNQKIGGPANCYLETEFINILKRECDKFDVQPDFYSFHRYGRELEDMLTLPVKARTFLDSIGWNKTKIMINEWHFLRTWQGIFNNFTVEGYKHGMLGLDGVHGINSAAFNICTVCGWHDTPLDEAYYYGCGDNVWGFRTLYKSLNKNYYSMVMLGNLFTQFSKRVSVENLSETQRALAAISDDGKKGILLIGDFCGSDIEIKLNSKTLCNAKITKCIVLDDQRDNVEISVDIEDDGMIHLKKSQPGSAAFEVFFDLT